MIATTDKHAYTILEKQPYLQPHKRANTFVRMDLADRIKAARKHAGLTQRQLAEAAKVEQPLISQLENRKTLKTAHIAQIATACRVSSLWLASGDGSMLTAKSGEQAPGAPSEKDYALIPQYTAKGSAGNGHLNEHVEVKGGLAFKRDWLARLGVKEHRCSVIYAQGVSMEPSICDGEVVLLDHDDTEPRDGKIYLLQRGDGELIIKRLVKQMSGWAIRSDNEDKRRFPDETISADSLSSIQIVGRVVWRGGGL